MDLLGLRHKGGDPQGGDIARSASVLVDAGGTILWSSVADNYRVRPNPDEVLVAVRSAMEQ